MSGRHHKPQSVVIASLSGTNARRGSRSKDAIFRYKTGLGRRNMAIARKAAIARGFLELGAGRIDEIEHGLKASSRLAKRMAGYHDTRAAMAFAAIIKSKFDLRTLLKKPFREKTDSFGRPMHLLLGEIDRIRKTDCNTRFPLISPGFALGRHIFHQTGYTYLTSNNILSNRPIHFHGRRIEICFLLVLTSNSINFISFNG
jgi:hypothetical protein